VGLVLLRLFEPLPYRVLVWLGSGLGATLRRLPIAFVRTARRNLELCLPEIDGAVRERVLAEHFRSLGIALFETAMAWWSSDRRIRAVTELEGVEHLERISRRSRSARGRCARACR
jgi:KDO2-lipid IV(A) lauroyltransferase